MYELNNETSVTDYGSVLYSASEDGAFTSSTDRPFNAFRVAATDIAASLVSEVKHLLLSCEAYDAPRKRQRKPADQQMFNRQVEALVCDLVYRELTFPEGWLTIPLANSALGSLDRYKSKVLSKTIKDVLGLMTSAQMGFVECTKGRWTPWDRSQSTLTTIRAGEALLNRIQDYGLTCADFKLDKTAEVIVLKDSKNRHDDNGAWLQYEDTEKTNAYRADMNLINGFLAEAELGYSGAAQRIDLADRHLQRIFNNGSFEQGGRLFGGFWMGMSKVDRRGILIQGKPTVTLDFGQMNPRILYGKAGHDCGFDDAYSVPGLEQSREGVKALFNSMLHRSTPITKMPRGVRELFPQRLLSKEIITSVLIAHAPIKDYFYKGIGMHLMYDESQILVRVLTTLTKLGIVALPIHDAVIVPTHHQGVAMSVMLGAFKERCGIAGVVKVEA